MRIESMPIGDPRMLEGTGYLNILKTKIKLDSLTYTTAYEMSNFPRYKCIH